MSNRRKTTVTPSSKNKTEVMVDRVVDENSQRIRFAGTRVSDAAKVEFDIRQPDAKTLAVTVESSRQQVKVVL